LFSYGSLTAQNPVKESLEIADSLFQEKKYTESYEIYESIFDTGGKYSPSMLLKMAFIKEGLGDYSMALYFLDYYYQKTANKSVLQKMDELAEQHELTGYDYSDLDLIISYWHKYHVEGLIVLLFLCLITLIALFYRFNRAQSTFGSMVLLFLLLVLTGFMINFGLDRPRGIIISDNTYIMEDPSSASDLIDIVDKGHKVKIHGKDDVWYEIEWRDETAWIRENNLILTHR
jgi:hypothetical protein